jgi:predicted ester cyclase
VTRRVVLFEVEESRNSKPRSQGAALFFTACPANGPQGQHGLASRDIGWISVGMKFLPVLLMACLPLAPANAGEIATLESNKAVARKVLEEVLGKGLIEENEEIYAAEFTAHGIDRTAGREEDRQAVKMWRTAFPDLKMTVTHVVAEADMVAVRYIGEGTNTGPVFGSSATGNRIKIDGITIFRLKNRQITDEWTSFDMMGLMRQLGLLPSSAGAK